MNNNNKLNVKMSINIKGDITKNLNTSPTDTKNSIIPMPTKKYNSMDFSGSKTINLSYEVSDNNLYLLKDALGIEGMEAIKEMIPNIGGVGYSDQLYKSSVPYNAPTQVYSIPNITPPPLDFDPFNTNRKQADAAEAAKKRAEHIDNLLIKLSANKINKEDPDAGFGPNEAKINDLKIDIITAYKNLLNAISNRNKCIYGENDFANILMINTGIVDIVKYTYELYDLIIPLLASTGISDIKYTSMDNKSERIIKSDDVFFLNPKIKDKLYGIYKDRVKNFKKIKNSEEFNFYLKLYDNFKCDLMNASVADISIPDVIILDKILEIWKDLDIRTFKEKNKTEKQEQDFDDNKKEQLEETEDDDSTEEHNKITRLMNNANQEAKSGNMEKAEFKMQKCIELTKPILDKIISLNITGSLQHVKTSVTKLWFISISAQEFLYRTYHLIEKAWLDGKLSKKDTLESVYSVIHSNLKVKPFDYSTNKILIYIIDSWKKRDISNPNPV